jgi:hypothetical protein
MTDHDKASPGQPPPAGQGRPAGQATSGGHGAPVGRAGPAKPAQPRGLAVRNVDALVFAAEMYGLQLDLLAALTGGERSARAAAARWRELGYAETGRLSPGAPWLWATGAGLAACGFGYRPGPPALAQLAHTRAVAAARIALEATDGYRAARAYWRCERRLRAGRGVGVRQHLPDAEVHWPDGALGADGTPAGWAGECWAIEAEVSPKTVARTTAIIRETLLRTGDYGCAAVDVSVPGRPPRHARVLYLCSPAALPTVLRARAAVGPLAARVEVRDLPPTAFL